MTDAGPPAPAVPDRPTRNGAPPGGSAPVRRTGIRRWLFPAVRWGVAIVGIWLVVASIHVRDRVIVFDPQTAQPVDTTVATGQPDDAWPVTVTLPDGTHRSIPRQESLVRGEKTTVRRQSDGATLRLLYLQNTPEGLTEGSRPARLLVSEGRGGSPFWIANTDLAEPYVVGVPFPPREIGLARMLRSANRNYLLLSLAVIPAIYFITGYRWWLLLKCVGIQMSAWQAIRLNLVGSFYNTFLPGSTGGDVVKAYYAAKHAHTQRTRAVLSVVVDRAVGLLALIIMGGACAALQWHIPECRRVAAGAGIIVGGLAVAVVVLGVTGVRKALGLDYLMRKLPLQERVVKATDALREFRANWVMLVVALVMSFPVHATVVLSAMFAAWAFALPLASSYYWVVVPTVVLAGALPISPQGAGVMEAFAILLTRQKGATIGQAVALTLSIRLVQVVWNLAAGLVVLRGGYHTPTPTEEAESDAEDAKLAAAPEPTREPVRS